MPWPTSNHESPDVNLAIPGVTAPHYLWAFLETDGQPFRENDYGAARAQLRRAVELFSDRKTGGQSPDPNVSEQRLRTWKSAFEEMGLLTVESDGTLRATRLGRAVVDGWIALDEQLEGTNRRIAALGAEVANRVLLAKPDNRGKPPEGIPEDSDIFPLRAIWRAFRHLGDRLHWQDINRVLGHIHYEREIDPALEQIAAFREKHGASYAETLLDELGPPLTSDPRHITPWFNRAGIGGFLIPSEADSSGFRTLTSDSATIFDGLLGVPVSRVPAEARHDRTTYIRYLMQPVERAARPSIRVDDQSLMDRIVQAAQDFGRTKFIVLSGLPGTGKSRAARLAADILTDGDPLCLKDIQFHESTTYEDFIEGFVPRPDGHGFERKDKTFRIINQRALDDPGRPHILLIEEFTRANTHSVLGELLTFVEHRGRKFTLPLSQHEISISPDLVLVATMNPRDRSALTLDDAVRRRMHMIPVPPSVSSLKGMLREKIEPSDLESLAQWFERYLSILPFGHGLFAGADSPEKLRSIWEGTVVPLLADPLGRVPDAYDELFNAFPFRDKRTS